MKQPLIQRPDDDLIALLSAPSLELSGVRHVFGTKSQRALALEDQFALQARAVARALFATPEQVCWLNQIHSRDVVIVDAGDEVIRIRAQQGDALITTRSDVIVAAKTADCVPILLADPKQRVVAAVHAGWRGLALGIVEQTLRMMMAQFRCTAVEIHAGIGPHIRPCCFCVGQEVADQFCQWPQAIHPLSDTNNDTNDHAKYAIDLGQIASDILVQHGLQSSRISGTTICTSCRDDLCYSFRRQGDSSGRQLSAIRLMEN